MYHIWCFLRFLIGLPPAVFRATDGLGYAVHGFTIRYCHRLVLAPVLVLPGGDDQQAPFGTEVDALRGGMVDGRESVVGDENHGETVIRTLVDDFLFAGGDAGADEDGAPCRLFEAARLLAGQEGAVAAVADHGQQPPREEGTVAVAVAGDVAVGEEQALLDGRKGVIGGLQGAALLTQVFTQGGDGQGRVDAAAPCLQAGAVMCAESAAPWVVSYIGALSLQLARLNGHHVAVKRREKGDTA